MKNCVQNYAEEAGGGVEEKGDGEGVVEEAGVGDEVGKTFLFEEGAV